MSYRGLVSLVREGELVTARELARRTDRKLSTAFRVHLERACRQGELERHYGWTGKASGWLYCLPGSAPFGFWSQQNAEEDQDA